MTISTPEIQHLDLKQTYYAMSLPSEITLDAEVVAADLWEEILERTYITGKEHGLNIGHDRMSKSLRRSKIYQGTERSLKHPLLPFGLHSLKELVGGIEPVLDLHSHPKHPEVAHLKTTAFTDQDIDNFLRFRVRAKLMIDHGGKHLLLGNFDYSQKEDFIMNYVHQALNKAGNEHQTMYDVLYEVANRLEKIGLRYFFTNTSNTQNGKIPFTDVRRLKSQSE